MTFTIATMPMIRIHVHLPLLLAVLCIGSMVWKADSLSSISNNSNNANINNNNNNNNIFKNKNEPNIGIRPELSKDSYAHRSAIDCRDSFGTIDVKIASEEKGLGAFATVDIPFGTLVGKYNGEILDLAAVNARFWNKSPKTKEDLEWEESRVRRRQGITGHFLFELPNGSFVDAEDADKSSWIRFMNHAAEETPECNVQAFIKTSIADEDEEFPLMYAISDIRVGEELCWNYGGMFFAS